MATASGVGVAVKIPPHNLEAEVAILGGILINQNSLSEVRLLLSREDFYKEAHRIIYRRMLELDDKSEPVDAVTLGNLLDRMGELQRVGGVNTIADIINAVSTSAGIISYANIVRDLSIRRQLILKCSEIAEECFTGTDDVSSLLDKTEHSIFSIREQQKTDQLVPLSDALNGVFSRLMTIMGGENDLTGLSTGFLDIDRLTLGMQPSELLILAARPSMGKTALALNIAYNAVKKTMENEPKAALIFSLEMAKEALVSRLLCLDSGVSGYKLKGGYLNDREMESLKDSADRLSEMPVFIDDSNVLSPFDIKAKCRRIARENKLGLVVIDYIQLMEGSIRRSDSSREQEIASISKMLKGFAKELNIPVLALSQLNRKTEEGNRRPQMSDLRESGALEQDADIVMFIHPKGGYTKDTKESEVPRDISEVIIAKQRNGPTGIVELLFQKDFSRFKSLATRDHES